MEKRDWAGVFPDITTPFQPNFAVDYEAFERQIERLLHCGCRGIVALGSLSEAMALAEDEKIEILRCANHATRGRAPLIAGISSLSTAKAAALAEAARVAGADGLMVWPPSVCGDWRETHAHLSAVFRATPLSCMLYNHPIAYGTDVTADQMVLLHAQHKNFHAVKDSSGSVRRINSARHLAGDKLAVFVGMDDRVVDGMAAGAEGWITGLANALPAQSAHLFAVARHGPIRELDALCEWFVPLLRFDSVPKSVQLIKLLQAEMGLGTTRVRPPRMELAGVERDQILDLVRATLTKKRIAGIYK